MNYAVTEDKTRGLIGETQFIAIQLNQSVDLVIAFSSRSDVFI